MVRSSKKAKKYNFIDYQYAREVVRDFPKLINYFEKLIPVLEQYQQYTGAWNVLQSVYDSKILLQIQYDHYKRIYDKKGLEKDNE